MRSFLISYPFVGMVTTWNKLCFTTGYIEVSISLPGTPQAPGFWPGGQIQLGERQSFSLMPLFQVHGPWVI